MGVLPRTMTPELLMRFSSRAVHVPTGRHAGRHEQQAGGLICARYFADVLQLTLGATVELDFRQPWHRSGPVFGDPRLAPYRLGQQSFKVVVLDSYHRRCAISGTRIPPVQVAAMATLNKLAPGRVFLGKIGRAHV